MKQFKDSELILNSDKSVYHLKLHSEQLADNVIIVGDPERVNLISSFFDKIEHKVQNREIITHTGWFQNKRISAMSTGMGIGNIDICLNEMNVLTKWDIINKKNLDNPRKLNIVRIGTTGALQTDIAIETPIVSVASIGIDNLLNFYEGYDELINSELSKEFRDHTDWPETLNYPYSAFASENLLNLFNKYMKGITLTAPGFYAPQFRNLFIPPAFPDLMNKIENFRYNNMYIANFEMESSALYGFGKLMKHNVLTLCLVIANRKTGEFSKNYKIKMKSLIEETLYNLKKL